MNSMLLLSLLLAHVIGDFYLQTDALCRQKETKKIKSPYLYLHALTVGAVSWLMVWKLDFWVYAVIILLSHALIDLGKAYWNRGISTFCLDQLMHIGVLVIISMCYHAEGKLPLEQIAMLVSLPELPVLSLAVLLSLKPTNILIKLLLQKYDIFMDSRSTSEMKKAGALIGNLERILTLVFVLTNHYEAIGFIIAAKSLLRFRDTDTGKTEYVLAGTFLSFGIAILLGLLVLRVAK
ncbi:DUF3307 domain-containing protein [uncultured Bacteroides sp.]|uniref:DUF3307 domain-containing protein n=1 Tax=uncultured Bacteroides sp. TaxID=162156 RepID=UPI002623AC24|nr:DUF3307 domain-containing protein [uncultured Bacteroides sp.]